MSAYDITLNRLKVAMLNFVIVAALGSLLRFYFFHPFSGFIYPYVMHAHSHMAFLGWVFMALYSLLLYAFLPEAVGKKKWTVFFIAFQTANFGMLFTFPFTGYALWSIVFSTVHAVASMVFAVLFIREARTTLKPELRMAFNWVKWGLILMFISNLGPFALGPVSTQGKSDLYYLIIYYYLHFQYNGWFTFAVIGLLLWQLERKGVNTDNPLVRVALQLKVVSIFPAYILSMLWLQPSGIWYIFAGMTGLIQLFGAGLLVLFIVRKWSQVAARLSAIASILFGTGVLAMGLQHILQFLSALPFLGGMAFERNVVIAYLHLVLIGFISIMLLFYMLREGFIECSRTINSALTLFLAAFVLSEFVLLFQPHILISPHVLFALALTKLFCLILVLIHVKKSTSFAI